MNFYVMTLFPEMITEGLKNSITGRAQQKGLFSVDAVNIRDYTTDRHKKVDDYTYGGGAGMLMQAQPVYDCWKSLNDSIKEDGGSKPVRVVYVTPQGELFTQSKAAELAACEDLIFLCGHYEGIDERVLEEIVTDYISIGDYVLTGGELPAMVMIDAIARLVPGVLNNNESAQTESHSGGLLEYPQYSRPEEWHGKKVPEVLLSGHHANIERWRLEQSIERTKNRRRDMYEAYMLSNPPQTKKTKSKRTEKKNNRKIGMDSADFSTPMKLKNVVITDEFWHREQELVRTQMIPYQWEALNDRVEGAAPSFCMRNFKVAGRLIKENKTGSGYEAPKYTFRGFEALPENPLCPDDDRFYGFVFQDTDFSKWIEAVAYSLINMPDKELEKTADEAIEIVCAAQLENGYLDTYYIINGMDKAFTNLRDHHELYCMGHLIEGAVAYYEATGKDRLLKAACRFADYVCGYFGDDEGKCKGYPGHEIAEMALVRLYNVTGEKKYLELSRFFLLERGKEPFYFDSENQTRAEYGDGAQKPDTNPMRYAYNQAHKEVYAQDEAVGHAVRAVYLYSGMADVARLTGDEKMYEACRRLWNSIVGQKLYITGGIGATHIGESFSFPYDLPNDTAYSETCAAIGLVFFARRMLEIRPDSRYADVMELALYNTVPGAMSLDGKSFFYVNPLESFPTACREDERKRHVKPVRQKWFGCACCPPNIARMVGSLGAYAFTENETTIYTHLYIGSVISKKIDGKEINIRMETKMPWEGTAKVSIIADEPVKCTLAYRIPAWSLDISINTSARNNVETGQADGYRYFTAVWESGDTIEIFMPMKPVMLRANSAVREDAGKVAFMRGPVTYCAEEADNGKELHLCRVDFEKLGDSLSDRFAYTWDGFGFDVKILKIPGKRQLADDNTSLYMGCSGIKEQDVTLTLVPYYLWNNRGEGEMSVWLR